MKPLVAALALALSGCISVASRTVRVGPPQPRHPPGCDVDLAQDAPEELLDDYVRVGSVCVAVTSTTVGPPSLEDEAGVVDDELRRRACALGGELVTATGTCTIRRTSGTEFAVMRAR